MEFNNKITISVQFGAGNYCERKNAPFIGDMDVPLVRSNDAGDMDVPLVRSNDAEIAIWNKKGMWFDFDDDEVKGHVDTDEVAKWIVMCSSATDLDDLKMLSKLSNNKEH
jgi:hypothetical protein